MMMLIRAGKLAAKLAAKQGQLTLILFLIRARDAVRTIPIIHRFGLTSNPEKVIMSCS
jgi:hypothetical protein